MPAIVFTRSAPMADPALVEAMLGSYTMGPLTLVVRKRRDALLAAVPCAGELLLESAGGGRFTSPTMPAVAIEVHRADDGTVTGLMVDPVGSFAKV